MKGIGLKLKEVRETEQLTACELAAILNISPGVIVDYECNQCGEIDGEILTKITQHIRFKKFTLWLMTGDISPEIGQISPALSPHGHAFMYNPQHTHAAG